jgi:hypothetical protein
MTTAAEIARRRVTTPAPAGVEPDAWRQEALRLRRNREVSAMKLAKLVQQFTEIAGADFERDHAEPLAECCYWIQQLCFELHVIFPKELLRHRLRVERQNL